MPTRRNATTTSAGILRPEEFAPHVTLDRTPTTPTLAPWLEYHWTLRWDMAPAATFPSTVLPHPSCNVTVERGTARRPESGGEEVLVTGVTTRRFDVDVHGRGWVHGIKFRSGALTALTGYDAKALVDRTVPARDVLPVGVYDELVGLTAGTPPAVATATACVGLERLLPAAPDASYDLLLRVVAEMLADQSLVRVEEVLDRHGLGRRTLERLLARYVGVGPKWVLARYRMHDVVAALDEGYAGSLAVLAARYGWFDQAHFGRDFAAVVGCTQRLQAPGVAARGIRGVRSRSGSSCGRPLPGRPSTSETRERPAMTFRARLGLREQPLGRRPRQSRRRVPTQAGTRKSRGPISGPWCTQRSPERIPRD